VVFRKDELQKIRGRAKYDDNNDRWFLPTFFLKEKGEVALPRIKNSKGYIEENQEKRDLVFDDDPSVAFGKSVS
jgi:hypothetical protein